MRGKWPTVVVTGLICLTVLVISIFVWPTPYRYEKRTMRVGDNSRDTWIQINRFTGEVKVVFE